MTDRNIPSAATNLYNQKVFDYQAHGETLEEAEKLAALDVANWNEPLELPNLSDEQFAEAWS